MTNCAGGMATLSVCVVRRVSSAAPVGSGWKRLCAVVPVSRLGCTSGVRTECWPICMAPSRSSGVGDS